jgi:hypothetical protein
MTGAACAVEGDLEGSGRLVRRRAASLDPPTLRSGQGAGQNDREPRLSSAHRSSRPGRAWPPRQTPKPTG